MLTNTFNVILDSQTLWIVLTLGIFVGIAALQSKIKHPTFRAFVNPLLLSIIVLIALLLVLNVPYETYQAGGQFVGIWVTPATVALAIKLEKNFEYFAKYYPAILSGIIGGVLVHTILVFIFAWIFDFDAQMVATLYPKSITTAIAVGVTESLGGIVSLTVALVVFTGVIGSVIGEQVLRAFKIDDPVAQGVALGMSAHAMGTSKAIQMGDVHGAMSGLSIIITGIVTVLLAPLVGPLLQTLL